MSVQLKTLPYWMDAAIPRFTPLDWNERADVVVVGGGITGLTAAYLLLRAGRSVVVLERRRLAESETGHTSAHVTMVTDLPMTDLIKQFGRERALAVWDAGLAAIDRIDQIVREERSRVISVGSLDICTRLSTVPLTKGIGFRKRRGSLPTLGSRRRSSRTRRGRDGWRSLR